MYDNLGDRMKAYERSYTNVFPPTLPIVVRVDGRSFHTYTKKMGFKKPFDYVLRKAMVAAAEALVDQAQNAKLAYVQSDEITLVMVLDKFESQHWFGGIQRKLESVSASIATVGFNRWLGSPSHWAQFDARAFSLPFGEVLNNLHWRILDAERNSIQMLGQKYFSHKYLQGMNNNQIQNELFEKHGVNWNNLEHQFKRGNIVLPNGLIMSNVPRVPENRGWWNRLIFNDCVYMEK